ncbi:MAG: NAD(P)-binding protein [Hyphomicrobium sp.]|nr:NAD(P)-binding protein [Hyphomicrobium sp.]
MSKKRPAKNIPDDAVPERIVIAGAGIGGLTAALALSRRGVASEVFERREALSEAGAGIQLGPNATKVLAGLGILESVRVFSSEPDHLRVHDGQSGRVLARMPLGQWMRERHGAPYLTVHRQDLHRALSSAIQGDPLITVSPGRDVVSFLHRPDGVDISMGNGECLAATALIAADGLWSKLRAQVTPTAAPKPAGKCAYRTVVPLAALPPLLSANDVHIWLAPGAHIVHYPVRQGSEVAVVVVIDGVASHESWNSAASVDALRASPISGFAAHVRDFIFANHVWRMWPLQKLAPVERWTNGATALLGDAAHPMLPFFAQGGGMAIEDAAVLAKNIAGDGTLPDRLYAYEVERKARVNRVVTASKTNGRIYHLDGPMALARNGVLAAAPPGLMMRRYDWLYGWTA